MRFKIEMPETIHFSTKMNIMIEHINYGNHLSNDKVLTLCHEARVLFYKSHNLKEMDVFGLGNIISDAQIQFINEGKHGDELTIDLSIDLYSAVAFNIYYHLFTSQKSIAKVKTGMLLYDYETKKVKKIPQEFALLF